MWRSLGRLMPVRRKRVEEGRPRQLHDVLEVALARRRAVGESLVGVGRRSRLREGPGELRELAQVVDHGAFPIERLLRVSR